MYDTEKRVAIVKKRIAEHRRRQARRSIRSLFALCVLLFLSLVGTVGTVGTVRGQPIDAAGMYGAILLHESAGGYVLVAVISFMNYDAAYAAIQKTRNATSSHKF